MATVIVTFSFDTTAQSFTSTPGTSVTMSWDGTFGNPVGSLKSTRPLKAASSATSHWAQTLTWVALGVPSGATVTGVTSASMYSCCSVFTSAGSGNQTGAVTLVDGATTITLAALRSITAVDNAVAPGTFVQSVGVNSTGLTLAASDSITITIPNTLVNTNVTGSTVTIYQDLLSFTITYTPAPTRLGGRTNASINQNLIGHWMLNEGSGSTAHDISGNINHGTLISSPAWVNSERFGQNLQFTAASVNYVDCGNIADFGATDSFSCTFWAKYSSSYTQFDQAVNKSTNAGNFTGWYFYMDQSGAGGSFGGFKIVDVHGTAVQAVANNGIPNGKWHLVAGVVDRVAQLIKISIDGSIFNTASISTVGSPSNTTHLTLGGAAAGGQTIQLHDVRVFGRALNLSEINKLYNPQRLNQKKLFDNFRFYSSPTPTFALTTDYYIPAIDRLALNSDEVMPLIDRLALNKDNNLPIIDRLTFNSDQVIPIIDRLALNSDEVIPLIDRLALQNDQVMPLIDQLALLSDRTLPVIDRLALLSDKTLPLIDRLNLNSDEILPLIDRLAFLSDQIMPVIDRLAFNADQIIPVIDGLVLLSDQTLPLIDKLAVLLTNDIITPLSTSLKLTSDQSLPLMGKLAVLSDEMMPLIDQLRLLSDEMIPIMDKMVLLSDEILPIMDKITIVAMNDNPLSSDLLLNGSQNAPLFTKLIVFNDEVLPILSLGNVATSLTSDAILPLFYSLKLANDQVSPLVDKLNLSEDLTIPMMSRTAILTDLVANIATKGANVMSARLLISTNLLLQTDTKMPVFDRLDLVSIADLRLASGLAVVVFSDGNLPITTKTAIVVHNDQSFPLFFYRERSEGSDTILLFSGGIRQMVSAVERALIAQANQRNLTMKDNDRGLIAQAKPRNLTIGWEINTQMSRANTLTPAIDATIEEEFLGFDFGPILATGVFISSIDELICSVAAISNAPDASAHTRLLDSPFLVASKATGAVDCQVNQLFGTAVGGVTYLLQCAVTTTDGQTLSLWSHLSCVAPS